MDNEFHKIEPDVKPVDSQVDVNKPEAGSVLIPKIDALSTDQPKMDKPNQEKVEKQPKTRKKFSRKLKIVLGVIGFMLLTLIILTAVVGKLAYDVYKDALALKSSAESLVAAGQAQDLEKIKNEIDNTEASLNQLHDSYNSLKWTGAFPYLGMYIKDGDHALNAASHGINAAKIVITTVEPYSDIIGLTDGEGDGPADGAETAQDRLDFLVSTIPDVVPRADELAREMDIVKSEIDQIDVNRYPDEFRGIEVKSKLKKGIELIDLASSLVSNGKPLLEVAPDLLGSNEPRTYLVLFQNDKELRPTGGFLTAYSIATVEKGKFKPVSSSDIYNLDENYKPTQAAPYPIITYLKGPYTLSNRLRLRDINWSPDFKESMSLFAKEAESVGIKDIDGIIAVDTQLLVNLLDAIGPIGVPGFGNFSTENDPRCNCPNVIYELESFADVEGSIVWDQNDPTKIIYAPANYENRKEIIGPLMNSVLSNALGQSKEKIPALFEAGFNSLIEKHVLFYLVDEKEQKAAEAFGIAGTIAQTDGDYLYINDANLGGRKSNLYVTQEVEQEITVGKDGSVEKTVTITYKNSEKHDGWLNSVLPNWMRIYVPEGSELLSVQGLEDKKDPYDELGKTVFSGLFKLKPEGVAKVIVTYKLPFKATGDKYNLTIQKQPGVDMPLHTIRLGKQEEVEYLKTDKDFTFEL